MPGEKCQFLTLSFGELILLAEFPALIRAMTSLIFSTQPER